MRVRSIILGSIFLPLMYFSSFCEALALDASFRSDIDKIVNDPVKVYDLDLVENKLVFENIEKWVKRHIDLQKASCRSLDHRESVQCKLEVRENISIPYADADVDGVVSPSPFNIYFDKQPRSRSFHKALWVPTQKTQDKNFIADLGKKFIQRNRFVAVTNNDDIFDFFVLSWKSRIIREEPRAGDTYTILHRAKYFRRFHDLEVINSKQIVDFHPASLEIISYKSIMWTPIDESSGKYFPYLPIEEVIAQVDSFFVDEMEDYKIAEVQLAWYQSDYQIFPVLVIHTQRSEEEEQLYPMEQTLLVSLVKDIRIDEDEVANALSRREPQNLQQ